MNIAIVDDCLQDLNVLKDHIQQYQKEHEVSLEVTSFTSGKEFLDSNRDFDVVFLDIEMPEPDGLKTARILRERDKSVPIIFETNMANYALKGYEVNAMDFIVKPVVYSSFQDRFSRAIAFARTQEKKVVMVNGKDDEIVCIYTKDIHYIEKEKNYTFYHTAYGTYNKRQTLEQAISSFSGYTLLQASSGLFINPNYLEKILPTSIIVGGEEMPLARRRKQKFIEEYMQYLSQRNREQ